MPFTPASRVSTFGTTIFAEMTHLAIEHQAINLSQGFPDFDGPGVVKDAALAMADFTSLGPSVAGQVFDDDVAFCRWLTAEVGVAAIPPTAFYSDEHKPLGRSWARFAFCKRQETLEHTAERLGKLRKR